MKTKLLRKVRKRFSWYVNKNGYPVLIDFNKNKVHVFERSDLISLGYTDEFISSYSDGIEMLSWRVFKKTMLDPYGYTKHLETFRLRLAKRNFNRLEKLGKKKR